MKKKTKYELILNYKEIKYYNDKIKDNTDKIYDIYNIDSISKNEIESYINSYNLPKLPKYNGNIEITPEIIGEILENRNIDKIKNQNKIVRGIIVSRANLRSFPTDIHFYDKKNIPHFDRLQETELHVNTPVLILHKSKDNLWYFVISQIYIGWVKCENIAYATINDFNYFIESDKFGIITESSINVNNVILDMSVKLPFITEDFDNYILALPKKSISGHVIKEEINISKQLVNIGYLPYTKFNIYQEAFKYLGVKYSWGGLNDGVDCSSFISNIYRTFGFIFPRNVSSQNKSVGIIINLNNKTLEEKLNIIDGNNPCLLYKDDHVMLYLGKMKNKHYIIHASGDEMKVVITELTLNSKYLKDINKLVKIEI